MNSVYSHITGRGSVVCRQMAIGCWRQHQWLKPIRLLFEDTANSVEADLAHRAWWLFEGVDVIADVASSPLALAVQEINRPAWRGRVLQQRHDQ